MHLLSFFAPVLQHFRVPNSGRPDIFQQCFSNVIDNSRVLIDCDCIFMLTRLITSQRAVWWLAEFAIRSLSLVHLHVYRFMDTAEYLWCSHRNQFAVLLLQCNRWYRLSSLTFSVLVQAVESIALLNTCNVLNRPYYRPLSGFLSIFSFFFFECQFSSLLFFECFIPGFFHYFALGTGVNILTYTVLWCESFVSRSRDVRSSDISHNSACFYCEAHCGGWIILVALLPIHVAIWPVHLCFFFLFTSDSA